MSNHAGRSLTGIAISLLFSLSCTDSVVVPVAVDEVELTPETVVLEVGETQRLSAAARGRGRELNDREVSWSTADAGLVRVGDDGEVEGVAVGSTTVTATSEGKVDHAEVNVVPAAVASIEVTPAEAELVVGGTLQLQATARDARGSALSGRTLTWASENEAVARVDAAGQVTAIAEGETRLSAAAEGRSGLVRIAVSRIPVDRVVVDPAVVSLVQGATVQLTATVSDASGGVLEGREVAWSSAEDATARVDAGGLVSGVAVGNTTITASSEGRSAEVSVTVTPVAVATITLTPSPATVEVGGSVQLTATPRDEGGNPLTGRVVTWESSAEGIASVSGDGRVTGMAVGTATVTARSEGMSASVEVTVVPVPVATVEVAPTELALEVGERQPLTATLRSAAGTVLTGREVTWSSDAASVALVDPNGTVRGVAPGTAWITAHSEGRSSAPMRVDVRVRLELAYSSNRDGNYEIYAVSVDGTRDVRLTSDAAADDQPRWSPSGERIAFRSRRDGGAPSLFVMNADGTGVTRLSATALGAVSGHRWMPDGEALVFAAASGSIYRVNADGTGLLQLTSGSTGDVEPHPSPDGGRIAFVRSAAPSSLYLVERDGTGEARVTGGTPMIFSPRWSPDGTRIVMEGRMTEPEDNQIYLISPDGSGLQQLTRNAAFNFDPSWSPAGDRLLFLNDGDLLGYAIFVINADGTGERRLVQGSVNVRDAVWSPEGGRIAFAEGLLPWSTAIYVINADGSGRSRVTAAGGHNLDVDWRP